MNKTVSCVVIFLTFISLIFFMACANNLDNEAAEQVAKELDGRIIKCGDHWYWKNGHSKNYYELNGIKISIISSKITESERLKGIEWQGCVKYVGTGDYRTYPPIDDYVNKRWSDWNEADSHNKFEVRASKKNGQWSLSVVSNNMTLGKNEFEKITCSDIKNETK